MYIRRYTNPYRDARRGFEVLNALLNTIEGNEEETALSDFVPAVNTREDDKSYIIELDLPGIDKNDIEITTEDNVLTVSGERKYKNDTKEGDYYKIESVYGKFSRSFTLPEKVDADKITAKSENGVLEVIIPKAEEKEKQPKKIEIK